MLKFVGALLLAAVLGGCATTRPPLNQPLPPAPQGGTEYRLSRLAPKDNNSDSLVVVLNFSGGGIRAAAFAHGVLQELRNTRFRRNGEWLTLLDEVDVVAGVSGGSVTAAYFAAFGDAIFGDFERRFLKADFQGTLLASARSPANAYQLSSPWFGRGHLLARHLDEDVFRGITYGDLAARGTRPFLLVVATDLTQGTGFEFSRQQFDLLCSRLDDVPLAVAVAASSAVPIVMSPITVRNAAGSCAGPREPAAGSRLAAPESYMDSQRRPYIHLVDGGLSDNLALRGIIDAIANGGGIVAPLEANGFQGVGKLVIISVNAAQGLDVELDRSDKVPSVTEVVAAISSATLVRRSTETRAILAQGVPRWRQQLRTAARAGSRAIDPSVDIYFIEVDLLDYPEAALRRELQSIPTALSLPPADVDKLIAAGGRILRESSEFRRLRQDLAP